MFIRLTDKHKKVILWAMLIVIVPAFVLWGSSALRGNKENVIGQIEDQPIKRDEFVSYVELAQLYWMLNAEPDQPLEREDIYKLAGDFYLLLHQANQEKIKVSDREVIDYIQSMPFFLTNGEFDSEKYQQFIRHMQRQVGRQFLARNFEEYVRNVLKREKLFAKHIDVEVTDSEVLKAYKIKNQEAKISYLLIAYDDFNIDQNIPRQTLEEFYEENKELFTREVEIKLKYISLLPDEKETEAIIRNVRETKSFAGLEGVSVIETEFFAEKEPIKGIGFVPQVNQILFSLENDEFSPALRLEDTVLIFQKIEEKEGYTPSFTKIQDEVKQTYVKEQAKTEAREIAKNILQEIKTTDNKNLKKYTQREEISFSQTEFFKYFNYIKGLGLSEKISQLVFFELKEDEIYAEPVTRKNGIYIIKLNQKTEIDQAEFSAEKEKYYQALKSSKLLQKKLEYLANLERRLNFRLKLS